MSAIFQLCHYVLLFAVLSRFALADLCSNNSDCEPDYFCGDSSVCERIPYLDVVDAVGAAASSKTNEGFSLLVITDIQYFFTIPKGEPRTECVFQDGMTKRQKKKALEAAVDREIHCIEHVVKDVVPDVVATVDLGDLTNTGIGRERNAHESFYGRLSGLNLPHVLSLGNHDYHLANDASASEMITYLEASMRAFHSVMAVRHVDFKSSPTMYNARRGVYEKYTTGSLCFSIEFNGYLFVVMHWSTALAAGSFERDFHYLNTDTNTNHFLQITGPRAWIENELADAKLNNLDVVLMPHSLAGLRKFMSREKSFSDTLLKSSVIGLISGHVHDAYGKHGDWTISGDSEEKKIVPIYYAGSTSYEKFIVARFAPNHGGLSVDVYDSKHGDSCSVTLNTSGNEAICPGQPREISDISCV